jgi:uncharacterized lipoprotein YddW (UPF0748 family)
MKIAHLQSYFSIGWLFSLISLISFAVYPTKPAWAATPEIRGVWVAPEVQFDPDPVKGKAMIREFVERLANANFNVILAEMTSDYFAALTDGAYQQKIKIARWDALGELVKVAKEKGLQVHLWYSFTGYKSPRSPEFNAAHHGNPSWASVEIDELNIAGAPGGKPPRKMYALYA